LVATRRAAPDRRYADRRLLLTNGHQRQGRKAGAVADSQSSTTTKRRTLGKASGTGRKGQGKTAGPGWGLERELWGARSERADQPSVRRTRRTRTRPSPCRRHDSRDNCPAQLACPLRFARWDCGESCVAEGSFSCVAVHWTIAHPSHHLAQLARHVKSQGTKAFRTRARCCPLDEPRWVVGVYGKVPKGRMRTPPLRVSGGRWTRTREGKQQGNKRRVSCVYAYTNNTARRESRGCFGERTAMEFRSSWCLIVATPCWVDNEEHNRHDMKESRRHQGRS
jgi:hypothetical protein